MKRIYVNEQWCLGCHLCEYNCAYANSGLSDMVKALKDKSIFPRIKVEDTGKVTYALSCRHCTDPLCVKSCISGAMHRGADGAVRIDRDKCVSCFTCILVCPFGAVTHDGNDAMLKCELCLENTCGAPACAAGCPNRAIVYEER